MRSSRILVLFLLLVNSVCGQERCGSNTCTADEFCCNRSCSICLPLDGVCSTRFCPSSPAACFSGTTTVRVRDIGPLPLSDLRVGDHVQTAGGEYHEVYAFGHHDELASALYLEISTANGTALEVSPKHLVFLQDSTHPVAARDVRVGDWLRSILSQEKGLRVASIEEVERTGVYAPLTTDGTLLVNGIAASSYVALDEFEMHPWMQSRMASLSHLALAPFRLFCTTTKSCKTYNGDGIPRYPALLLRFFQRTAQLEGIFFRWLLLGSYLLVAAAASFLQLFANVYELVVLFGAVYLCIRALDMVGKVPQ